MNDITLQATDHVEITDEKSITISTSTSLLLKARGIWVSCYEIQNIHDSVLRVCKIVYGIWGTDMESSP